MLNSVQKVDTSFELLHGGSCPSPVLVSVPSNIRRMLCDRMFDNTTTQRPFGTVADNSMEEIGCCPIKETTVKRLQITCNDRAKKSKLRRRKEQMTSCILTEAVLDQVLDSSPAIESHNLIGDFTFEHCLPLIQGKHSDLKTISPQTVRKYYDSCFYQHCNL